MLIQLCQFVMPSQFRIVTPLKSHALLNLEMIQVRKIKGSMNKVQFKDLLFNNVWVAEWNKQSNFKPVMISVVSSNPTGGKLYFAETFKTSRYQFCYRNVKSVL